MPLSPIFGAPSRIGGGWQSGTGGTLTVSTIAPPPPFTGNPLQFPPAFAYDVERWLLVENFEQGTVAGSGQLGADYNVPIGYSYLWAAEIVYDLARCIELALRSISGAVLLFQVGDTNRTGLVTTPSPRYYWCQRGRVESVSPAVKTGEGQKVRQTIKGVANCHILLLPEFGDFTDPTTIAGAYNQYLASNPNG